MEACGARPGRRRRAGALGAARSPPSAHLVPSVSVTRRRQPAASCGGGGRAGGWAGGWRAREKRRRWQLRRRLYLRGDDGDEPQDVGAGKGGRPTVFASTTGRQGRAVARGEFRRHTRLGGPAAWGSLPASLALLSAPGRARLASILGAAATAAVCVMPHHGGADWGGNHVAGRPRALFFFFLNPFLSLFLLARGRGGGVGDVHAVAALTASRPDVPLLQVAVAALAVAVTAAARATAGGAGPLGCPSGERADRPKNREGGGPEERAYA